jgi:HEAT repeat protein
MMTAGLLVLLTLPGLQDNQERMEELYGIASLWQVGENVERVKKAREDLIALGDEAVRFIVESKLGTRRGLEWRAVETVILGVGSSAIEPLQEKLRTGSLDEKRGAVSLLGSLGSREDDPEAREKVLSGIDDIFATLESGYSRLIRTTFGALARLKPDGAFEAIRPFLRDESEILRKEAVVNLGNLGDGDAIEDLKQVVIEGDFATRRPAARAIAKLQPGALESLLHHEDFRVRGMAAEAAVSADALIPLLEDPEGPVRGFAAEALGRIGSADPGPLATLEKAYEKERHPFARWAMGKALETLRGE